MLLVINLSDSRIQSSKAGFNYSLTTYFRVLNCLASYFLALGVGAITIFLTLIVSSIEYTNYRG